MYISKSIAYFCSQVWNLTIIVCILVNKTQSSYLLSLPWPHTWEWMAMLVWLISKKWFLMIPAICSHFQAHRFLIWSFKSLCNLKQKIKSNLGLVTQKPHNLFHYFPISEAVFGFPNIQLLLCWGKKFS